LNLCFLLHDRGYDVPFPPGQCTSRAGSKVPELYRTELNTNQALDTESERLTQPPHLARASFTDRNLELPEPTTDVARADVERLHPTVLELYTGSPRSDRASSVATHSHPVGALDFSARMGQLVGRFAVCREEKHTLGEVVETTDVCESRLVRHEVEDSASAVGIRLRCQNAGWFVQHYPEESSRSLEWFPVDCDLIAFGIDALLAKNLIYFFGHVFINTTIYMAVIAVYEIIPGAKEGEAK